MTFCTPASSRGVAPGSTSLYFTALLSSARRAEGELVLRPHRVLQVRVDALLEVAMEETPCVGAVGGGLQGRARGQRAVKRTATPSTPLKRRR